MLPSGDKRFVDKMKFALSGTKAGWVFYVGNTEILKLKQFTIEKPHRSCVNCFCMLTAILLSISVRKTQKFTPNRKKKTVSDACSEEKA